MKLKQLICALIAFSLLMPVVAGTPATQAPSGSPPPAPSDDESPPSIAYIEYGFRLFDRNGDGHITLDEAKASPPVVPYFRELDRDADGGISLAEWTAYFLQTAQR
ncbi:MAG TPA: EF-hand domain-containing protein [Aromatoleum sp.]|uniref:EF-hand domain-containing protein n=1 Tax=Aromatoleum sp. TaxID=2307007 RepID=UPI002B46B2A4|nr:EF-hand domain-containing protein [Aromatoleum sp.]HJV24298.1 EF-hand domain-containing protein [Aromatoleum sp.]